MRSESVIYLKIELINKTTFSMTLSLRLRQSSDRLRYISD